MSFYSPLRYPGGKGKLADYVQLIIEENQLFDCTYVEPFAGGSGVALSLLFNEYATKIVINDLNKSIYAFWYSVLNHTDILCQLIYDTPVTIEEWQKQRFVQQNLNNVNIIDLGFSTFFLNRTNRSGIISAGVIGGTSQSGDWKIDARYNKIDLIRRIEKIALYNDRIELYNLDVLEIINNILPDMPEKTLVYLDPPYFNKGCELYENHYKPQDHEVLSMEIIKSINQKWIVTYDNTPEICELYSNLRQITYNLNYSAANKVKGSEIMVFSDNLIIPTIDNPVKTNVR